MDSRIYKYVTCNKVEYDTLIGANDEYSNSIIYLERDKAVTDRSNPRLAIVGTNSNYQFRMPTECCTPSTAEESPIYEVAITKKVCACLECRNGNFQTCLHRDDIGAPVVGKVCGREYYQWPTEE